jgi:hypothetical protein
MTGSIRLAVPASLISLVALLSTFSAHAQDSLSAPLSPAIGDPVYSESLQTGPSTSLIPGGSNLTNPYLRLGISDPLGFLIESGFMSPYAPDGSMVTSYADADVRNAIENNSIVAERVSDYHNNHSFMSGAGSGSTLTGQAGAAGRTLSGRTGSREAGAAADAFGRVAVLAPFASGSSLLGVRQAGLQGVDTFIDPNAVVAASTSSAALSGIEGDPSSTSMGTSMSAPSSTASPSVMQSDFSTTMDAASRPLVTSMTTSAPGLIVPTPAGTIFGAAPGGIFPDVGLSMASTTGFQDSTMGTAGLPYGEPDRPSPLLSGKVNSVGTAFPEMSAETTHFLTPSIFAAAPIATPGLEQSAPLSEIARKARLHAMIYNPASSLPSPFEQRAMERAYERQKNSHRTRRPSTLTAPSIRP